jgi:hypothetical protein
MLTCATMLQGDRTAVEPHMARLLHCMLLCFKDMAWPVRDAACVACGRSVLHIDTKCVLMFEF